MAYQAILDEHEGLLKLIELRGDIEEALYEIEEIIKDFSYKGNSMTYERAKLYWLGSIKGMIRDFGSMVNFDDTLKEIADDMGLDPNEIEESL